MRGLRIVAVENRNKLDKPRVFGEIGKANRVRQFELV